MDKDHTSSLLSSLGVILRKDFQTERGIIKPEVQVGWLHEFSNGRSLVNASFADAPLSTFTVKGDRQDRDRAVFGYGLAWKMKKNFSLYLAYDARISGDRTEQGGSLEIGYRW